MRMTISVPEELKRQMNKVEGVNWSAIASRAFRQEVAARAVKKGQVSMDDVINRLRASAEVEGERQSSEGEEAGRHWAMKEATAAQLKRLAAGRDPVHEWGFNNGIPSAYGAAEYFYFLIEPD